jgi:amino acid transporter
MTTQETVTAPDAIESFYSRNTSGFVREISTGSAVAMNLAFMGIAYAVLVATEEPFAFSGGNFFWTTVIAGVLCVVPMLLYGKFLAGMPRSGGDYIFIGRSLHPWVGLAASLNINLWYILAVVNGIYLLPTFGLSSAFATIGATSGNQTFLNLANDMGHKDVAFIIAVVVLLVATLVSSLGTRRIVRIVNVLFLLSIVGVLVSIVVLLFHSRGSFIRTVPKFGSTYDGIIHAASAAKYGGTGKSSIRATILAMPLAFNAFGYCMATAYTGGEVRGARRTGVRGLLYALVIAVGLTAIMAVLSDRTFGSHFLGAATFLSNTGNKAYPFKAPSFFFFFVSMVGHSTILAVVIGASFVASVLSGIAPSFLIVSRSMFAWSFDRIMPEKLSSVNERTRSPLVANGTILVIGLIYLVFLVWGPSVFTSILYTITIGQLATFLTVALAAIVLPYGAPRLYEQLPIRKRIWGIPTISILGVATLLIYALFLYPLLTQSALGANADSGLIAVAVILAISIFTYPVAKWIQGRRGIDLSLINKELPPE